MRNTYADDAAVLEDKESKPARRRRIRTYAVQQKRPDPGATNRVDINEARELLDESAQLRFWAGVTIGEPDECWPWTRSCNPKGYGMTAINRAVTLAHRLAYVLVVGPITPGLIVRHRCDNPPCCNPNHLLMGTYAENSADTKRSPETSGTARLPEPEKIENGHLAWCHCGRAFLTDHHRLCPIHRQNRIRLPAASAAESL